MAYDWKKTAIAGLKFALIAFLGAFLADTSGLALALTHFLPPWLNPGPIAIGAMLAMLKNWLSNRNN